MTTTRDVQIVPSVLPANLAALGQDVIGLEEAGADRIQWDVMDGHFVPNLTFGPSVIESARTATDLPFEAHLMVANPDALLDRYVEAGCDIVIVHAETTTHLHRTLSSIRDLGAQAGVALNPDTPVDAVRHVLDLVSLVLVMTVNPGFGGQSYLASMEPKIGEIRALIGDRPIELEVDGGIRPGTIERAARAGADVFCAGSAIFGHQDGFRPAITQLRSLAADADTGEGPGSVGARATLEGART